MKMMTRKVIGWSSILMIGMFMYLNFFGGVVHNWRIEQSFWTPAMINATLFALTALFIIRGEKRGTTADTVIAYMLFAFGFASWMAWQSGEFHQYLFWIPLIAGVAVGFGHISVRYLKAVFLGHIAMLVLQSFIADEPGTMFQIANAMSQFGADFSFSHWYGMVGFAVLYVMFGEKGERKIRQQREKAVPYVEGAPRREEKVGQQGQPVQQQNIHRKSRPVKKPGAERAGNQENIKFD